MFETFALFVLDTIKRYHRQFLKDRVLRTAEEVVANTNEDNLPSAVVVGELYNNLSNIQNRIFISEMGTIAAKNAPPQGSADTNITFKQKYNNPPIVLITPTYIAAGISAGVTNITTTGCLISICNISPTARNVPANYIVISTD